MTRFVIRLGSHNRISEFACASTQTHEDAERGILVALAGGGWQPIGTAPQDGTYLLAIAAGQRIPAVIAWNIWNDAWADRPDPSTEARMVVHQPTHWMPLPEPPA